MNQDRETSRAMRRSRQLSLVATGVTLLVLSGTLAVVTVQLRARLRAQISGRDAQVLYSIATLQNLEADLGGEVGPADTPPVIEALMMNERLQDVVAGIQGVIAARLFDSQGKLITTLPPYLTDATIETNELNELKSLRPVSHFHPSVRSEALFINPAVNAAGVPASQPLLEVIIPLRSGRSGRIAGITQLFLQGQGIATEFAALDRHLAAQALGVFVAAGGLILAALLWAFRRLERVNRLLAERTSHLLKANAELSLAARTSAVGAVTSHLIHGLKNPLSGLQSFVASQVEGGPKVEDEWREAATAAHRMQRMVQDVVRVLSEEQGVTHYEMSVSEVLEVLTAKLKASRPGATDGFMIENDAEVILDNREANLVLLILENLASNAIQASPKGKSAGLRVRCEASELRFEVWDQGAGVPEAFRSNLFTPTQSSKPGGSGIGLAISKQLANRLCGVLELKETGSQGSVFALSLRLPGSDGQSSTGRIAESGA